MSTLVGKCFPWEDWIDAYMFHWISKSSKSQFRIFFELQRTVKGYFCQLLVREASTKVNIPFFCLHYEYIIWKRRNKLDNDSVATFYSQRIKWFGLKNKSESGVFGFLIVMHFSNQCVWVYDLCSFIENWKQMLTVAENMEEGGYKLII